MVRSAVWGLLFFVGSICADATSECLGGLKADLQKMQKQSKILQASLDTLASKVDGAEVSKPSAVVAGPAPIASAMFNEYTVKVMGSYEKIYSMLNPTKIVYQPYGMSFNLVPALGVYGRGYPRRSILLLLEFDIARCAASIPPSIQDALRTYDAASKSFCVVIQGSLRKEDNLRNNVIFHGLLADTEIKGKQPPKFDCKKMMSMGVFDTDVTISKASDIAINSLGERSVYCHDGRVSPDNAHVVLKDGISVVPFWTVGVAPDNRRVAITYHLVINDSDLSDRVSELVSPYHVDAYSLADLLQQLIKIDPALSLSRFIVP